MGRMSDWYSSSACEFMVGSQIQGRWFLATKKYLGKNAYRMALINAFGGGFISK